MNLRATQRLGTTVVLCGLLPLFLSKDHSVSAQSVARTHVRFDSDWRFHQDPPAVATANGTPITAWRWKFTAPVRGLAAADAALPLETDQADWQGASVGQDVFTNQPGFAWFRADLGTGPVPPAGSHRVLHFLSVDDNGTVYVNGKRMVRHQGWNEPFNVPVDSVWNPNGPNTLTILVQNTAGGGGIGQPATLEVAGPPPPVVLPAMARTAFNDQTWRTVHLPMITWWKHRSRALPIRPTAPYRPPPPGIAKHLVCLPPTNPKPSG